MEKEDYIIEQIARKQQSKKKKKKIRKSCEIKPKIQKHIDTKRLSEELEI